VSTVRFASFALLAALPGLAGCGSGSDSDTDVERPTAIEVSPEQFLDGSSCARSGLVAYVVTLEDTNPTETDELEMPIVLPPLESSPPTPCEQGVAFGVLDSRSAGIVPGRRYTVAIDGYDRADLSADPDEPRRLLDESGAAVEPRWTTTCPAIRAEFQQTRRVSGCEPLIAFDAPSTAPGRIEVSLDAILGDFACGAEPGQIESFTVYQADVEVGSAACGEAVLIEDVADGVIADLEILAFEPGLTDPSFRATCVARALANTTVPATCDPLLANGVILVDLALLAQATGAVCDGTLRALSLDPQLPDPGAPMLSFRPGACSGSVTVPDVAPGAYAFIARAEPPGTMTSSCSVVVEPGIASPLLCAAIP